MKGREKRQECTCWICTSKSKLCEFGGVAEDAAPRVSLGGISEIAGEGRLLTSAVEIFQLEVTLILCVCSILRMLLGATSLSINQSIN